MTHATGMGARGIARDEREQAIRADVQAALRRASDGDETRFEAEESARAERVIHEQIAAAERRAVTLGQPPFADRADLARRLLADLLGLGSLQPLLDDPAIEEIIVNGPRRVFVIADGRKELTEITLADDAGLLRLVRRAIGHPDSGGSIRIFARVNPPQDAGILGALPLSNPALPIGRALGGMSRAAARGPEAGGCRRELFQPARIPLLPPTAKEMGRRRRRRYH